jgi:hypothetical protein
LEAELRVALGLKLFAWRERRAGKDAVDVYRCALLCVGADVSGDSWAGLEDMKTKAHQVVKADFSSTQANGIQAIGKYLGLPVARLEEFSARLRANLSLVFGGS